MNQINEGINQTMDPLFDWQSWCIPWFLTVDITDIGGENVLLVSYQNTIVPVCSENYDSSWNAEICNALGFGYVCTSFC